MKKVIKLAFLYIISCGLAIVLAALLYFAYEYVNTKIEIRSLLDYRPDLTTQIYDRKGRLIANVFEQMRFYATFDEIPPRMVEALLAVEDTLFFEHSGINLNAISRAMLKNIRYGRYAEGGSTLTQQLVKNTLLTREKSIKRKIKEAIASLELEKNLSKEKILEIYLNEIFLGHGYYGVKAAARGYFQTELKDLSLKQIAMLVALPRSPVYYDPTRNLSFSLARANTIIKRMYELGWINETQLEVATKETPVVFDTTLSQNKAPYVVSETLRELRSVKNIKTGGYKIYLNIDLDYQDTARKALRYGYELAKMRIVDRKRRLNAKKPEFKDYNYDEDEDVKELNGAIVVTKNDTGEILALVGGIDFKESSFNRATQSVRQLGSAIKPFIYQIAFDAGYSTGTMIPDIARSYSMGSNASRRYWRPKNYEREFRGLVTLQTALTKSLNLATLNLSDLIGFNRIYAKMQEYGFEDIPPNLSILLGSVSISPINTAWQYSIFSNYGTRVKPRLIDYIVTRGNAKTIFSKDYKVITTPEQAFLTISALKNVVDHGTGRRANLPGIQLAGKTGTTNDSVDVWFCGFSPTVQTIIWYGRDDNHRIAYGLTGGVVAAPAFSYFYHELLKVEPGLRRTFPVPEGDKKSEIDGWDYYYTDTSPLPATTANKEGQTLNSNLIF